MSDVTVEQAFNSLVKGINTQLSNHADLITAAIDSDIDDYNNIVELAEESNREISRLNEEKQGLIKDRDELVKTVQLNNAHRQKVISGAEDVQKLSRTVHAENNRLNAELKELRSHNPKKLKEQVKRLKESNKSKDNEIKLIKDRLKLHENRYSDLQCKHNTNIDTLKRMHEMLKLEGANCEKQITSDDDCWFYVYRKPIVDDMVFRSTSEDGDEIDNRDFYFDIQTNKGISFHLMIMKSGEVGYPDVGLDIPDELKDYCREQYSIGDKPTEMIQAKVVNQDELDELILGLKNAYY